MSIKDVENDLQNDIQRNVIKFVINLEIAFMPSERKILR